MIGVAIFDFELSKGSVSQSVAWVCCAERHGFEPRPAHYFFNNIHLVLNKFVFLFCILVSYTSQ